MLQLYVIPHFISILDIMDKRVTTGHIAELFELKKLSLKNYHEVFSM